MANVADSFTRADASSLGTAPTGQTWSLIGGVAFAIVSNQAKATLQNSTQGAAIIDPGEADGSVKVTLESTAQTYRGLVFRCSDLNNFLCLNIPNASTAIVRKFEAGAFTTLNTISGLTHAVGDVWTVELLGSSIVVKQNGVQKLSTTSTFNQTATKVGMVAMVNALYDDFSFVGTAANTAPVASITAPATGTSVGQGVSVTFTGTGTDTEEGSLAGSSLAWSSSLDGAIGTGTFFSTSTLSVGVHTITLTATDAGGLTDTDTITLTITANTAPTATITGPADGTSAVQADTVTFTGTGTDPEDGTLTGTSLAWSSSRDGALGTGTSLATTTLTVGLHTITLTVTDSVGATDTDTITVTITSATGTFDGAAELPRTTPSRVYPTSFATSTTVSTAAALQAAINTAAAQASGDHEIIIADGASISGSSRTVLVPRSGSGWIVIRSETLPCAAGTRVHPSMKSTQGTIHMGTQQSAIYTQVAANVHHYILQGLFIEQDVVGTAAAHYNMIDFGELGSTQNSSSLVPDHLIIDRCCLRGDPTSNLRRCVALNSGYAAIYDSYLANAHEVGQDSQGISGSNGPGPYLIDHNYIEGAAENIMWGGADPWITNLVPSDITVTRNHLEKPRSWDGSSWAIKNLYEHKNCARVLVEANVIDGVWAQGQDGSGLVLKSNNQSNTAPWSGSVDMTIRYNFFRNMGAFCVASAAPQGASVPVVPAARMSIHNNVVVNTNSTTFNGTGRDVAISAVADFQYRHNTLVDVASRGGAFVYVTTAGNIARAKIENNISCKLASYGLIGTGVGPGGATWATFFDTASTFTKNIIQGTSGSTSSYPAGNAFPTGGINGPGFADPSISSTIVTAPPDDVCAALALAAASPYKGWATDGTDPGADIALLRSKLQYAWVTGEVSDSTASYTAPGPSVLDTPPPTALAVVSQPGTGTTNVTLPSIVVEIRDAFGVLSSSANDTITLGGSAALAGTLSVAAVNGVATFDAVHLTAAGTYTTLEATAVGLTSVGLSSIVIADPISATKLGIIAQPVTGVTGQTLSAVQIEVQDAGGSRVTGSTANVTLSGTGLSGTLVVAAVAGVATFSDLSLSPAGTYSALAGASTGLTGVTLAPIVVADPPPAPTSGKTLPKRLASKISAKSGDTLIALWFLT